MRAIIVVLLGWLLSGCSQFDTQSTEQNMIPNNHGLVLLRANADGRNVGLRILNVETSELMDERFRAAHQQSNLTILSLPVGKYTIARVDQVKNGGVLKFDALDKQLNFRVLPGKSVYLGDLAVRLPHNQVSDFFSKKTRSVSFYYSSNLLEVHEFMEDSYYELLARFPLVQYPLVH